MLMVQFLSFLLIGDTFLFYFRIPWNGKEDILIDRYIAPPSLFSLSACYSVLVVGKVFWYKIILIFIFYRFDGRALLDFIRDSSSRRFRAPEKTEEEEELEEFVNFERYRDLIKHQRRGCRYFFYFLSFVELENYICVIYISSNYYVNLSIAMCACLESSLSWWIIY